MIEIETHISLTLDDTPPTLVSSLSENIPMDAVVAKNSNAPLANLGVLKNRAEQIKDALAILSEKHNPMISTCPHRKQQTTCWKCGEQCHFVKGCAARYNQ